MTSGSINPDRVGSGHEVPHPATTHPATTHPATTHPATTQSLEDLIAHYILACEAGAPPDRQALVDQYPALAGDLRAFFAQRDRMEELARPFRVFTDQHLPTFEAGTSIRYVGDYELIEELARGGMGVIYKARQRALGRIVAVKLILSGRFASSEDVRRFHREARAAARLNHPNIVSIHEVGEHDGCHYFSMDYVDGRDLASQLRENPLPAREAAAYVRQMADALHYAHQQAILHRDIKPSNVLIDSSNQVHITDFGLAKCAEAGSDLTRTGQAVGTPSYMPPEQALGHHDRLGPASDVYALGAVLYECLTGRPPFRAETAVETLRQVTHEDPATPRLLNPGTPRDLDTICLKCLSKDPHHRYGSAGALAEDLGRFLAGEPILARPIGPLHRLWRWGRRNPLVATLGAAAAVLLVAITGVSVVAYQREARLHMDADETSRSLEVAYGDVTQLRHKARELERETRAAENAVQQAEQRTAIVERNLQELEAQRTSLSRTLETHQQKLYATLMNLAQREWQNGEIARADEYLEDCPSELRDKQWRRLKHVCHPAMKEVAGTWGLAISGDGRWLASARARKNPNSVAAQDQQAQFDEAGLWDVLVSDIATCDVIHALPMLTRPTSMAFSRDGTELIVGGEDGNVQVWNWAKRESVSTLTGHRGAVTSLAVSADGRVVASGSVDTAEASPETGEVLVWNWADRRVVARLAGMAPVDIDGAGRQIVYRKRQFASPDDPAGNLFRWEVAQLDQANQWRSLTDWQFPSSAEFQGTCAFSDDGKLLGVTSSSGKLEIWNVPERRSLAQLNAYGGSSLVFSSDGSRVAYAVRGTNPVPGRSNDSAIVWNLRTQEAERVLPWCESPITDVAFLPGENHLATTDSDGVKVWDVTPSADPTEVILADLREMQVGPFDWPQWGGSRCRVNTPAGKNIPVTWDPRLEPSPTEVNAPRPRSNIKWTVPLGSQSYGNPVVANGRVFVGTNNGHGYLERFPATTDLGVLLCFDEETGEFLWQHSNEKLPTGRVHDWPMQGVCSTPAVDGNRLWYVTNRGEVVCLDVQGFADGEDDGPVRGIPPQTMMIPARLVPDHPADPSVSMDIPAMAQRPLLAHVQAAYGVKGFLRRHPSNDRWYVYPSGSAPEKPSFFAELVDGKCHLWRIGEDDTLTLVERIDNRLTLGLDQQSVSPVLRTILLQWNVPLPRDVEVRVIEAGRKWQLAGSDPAASFHADLTLRGEVIECQVAHKGPLEHEADVVWRLDMMKELGVQQHNMSNCSPLIVEDWLFVCTSNGVDESHVKIPAPEAPSFVALNRWTGEVLWTDNSPGEFILHAQWASPSYGVFEGQPQVIFPGGDGWVYSFDPRGDGQGGAKLLWKFDGNSKESVYTLGGRATRNHIIAFPAIYDGLVYIVMGEDPEHGEGLGCLWCLDPTKRTDGSDVSETLAVDRLGNPLPKRRYQAVDSQAGERAIPNPRSAVVWKYVSQDRDVDGAVGFEEVFHRSLSIPVIKDDILYVADFAGLFHCLNAKTGKTYWTYDLLAACWGTALVVDNKVYIADEDGEVAIFRHSADPKVALKMGVQPVPWHGEIAMPTAIHMTPIVANDVLYIATRDRLYAIAEAEATD